MLHLKLALLVVAAILAVASGETKARLFKRYVSQLRTLEDEGSDFGNRPSYTDNNDFASSRIIGGPSGLEASHMETSLNVSQAVGMRLMGMLLVAMSVETPKSLSRLLFNGNESVDLMNKHHTKELYRFNEVRTTGDDEYACVNRCGNETGQGNRVGGAVRKDCSEMDQLVECVGKCIRPESVYAAFAHKQMSDLKTIICSANSKVLEEMAHQEMDKCGQTILNDTVGQFKLFHHAIGCYLKLEEASDNKDTCYVLKSCVFDSTADKVEKLCPGMKIIIGVVKPVFVDALTYLSDGRLVHECPSLYSLST